MRKVSIYLVTLAFTLPVFSQEASEVKKELSLYLNGASGNLNASSTVKRFSGNETEFGITYGQNFSRVPWLTLGVNGAIVGSQKWIYNNEGYVLYSKSGSNFTTAKAKLFATFGDYVTISLNTEGVLGTSVGYSFKFPANQTVKIAGDVDLFITGNHWYGKSTSHLADELQGRGIIDFLHFGFSYGVKFHPNWKFSTYLGIRTAGDYGDVILKNLYIRLNNTLSYNNNNGFGLWGQLRFEVRKIAVADPTTYHFKMNAGMSYSFDFSKL